MVIEQPAKRPEWTPTHLKQTSIDEIHQIMYILRGTEVKTEGDYRNQHLATVLSYLRQQHRENRKVTLSKLALMLGMAQRQVKENYFDGMINFGIINLEQKCDIWYWVGISAIENKEGELRKHEE